MIRREAILAAWWCLAAALLVAGGCGKSGGAQAGAGGKRTIVATTGMVADVVRRVGGERVEVTALMGEGVDPHLYKASPGDVRLLSDADMVFYSGLHLEGKMAEVLESMGKRKPVIAVTRGIPEAELRMPEHAHGQPDPHVWFDVKLWSRTIAVVRDELAKADVAHAPEYAANASAYEAELLALDGEVRGIIGVLPAERRLLVTAHDAFGYFGRAYGMEVRGIQGISTESEAGIRDINNIVDLLVSRGVPAVFVESSVPAKMVEALVEGCRARGHEVKVGGQLYSDAMGKAGTPEGTYAGMVRHNARTIAGALAGAGAEGR